jgi:hypothetical protein
MIDLAEDDIVHRRDTADGRFLLLHKVDLPPKSALPWSGVMLDIGGDGRGLQVALDPDGEAWTACDLLRASLARAKAEEDRRLAPLVMDVETHLNLALAAEHRCLGREPPDHLRYVADPIHSPYIWTVAVHGRHSLPPCPDPESRDEGVCGTTVDAKSRKLVQAARGTQGWVPWSEYPSAEAVVTQAKGDGYRIVVVELTANSIRPEQLGPPVPTCLVVGGREGGDLGSGGVAPPWRRLPFPLPSIIPAEAGIHGAANAAYSVLARHLPQHGPPPSRG